MSSAGLAAWTESLVSKCELSGKYQIVAAITARWRQRISTCQPSESVTWGNYWGRVRCDPIKSADNMEFGRLLGNIWMALHLIMIMMNRLYGWWECQEALGHPPVVTGVRSDHRHPVFIRTRLEFLYRLCSWLAWWPGSWGERSCVPSSSRDNQASSECQYQARPVSVTYFSIISGAGLMSDGEIGARTGARARHDWKHNLPGTSFTDLYWHYNHYSQEKP